MISGAATPRTHPPTPTRPATTVLPTAPPAGRDWGRRHHEGRPIGRHTGPATAATAVAGVGRVRSTVGPAVATACAGSAVAVVAAAGVGRVWSAAGPAVPAACAGSAAVYAVTATAATAVAGAGAGRVRREVALAGSVVGSCGVHDHAGGSRRGFRACLAVLRRGEVTRGTAELPRIAAAGARLKEWLPDGVVIAGGRVRRRLPGRAARSVGRRGVRAAVRWAGRRQGSRRGGAAPGARGAGAHALGVAPSRATGAADWSRTPSRWPPLPRAGRK